MEWIISIAIVLMGQAFMTICDPAKAQTVEEVRQENDLADADQGESGEGLD